MEKDAYKTYGSPQFWRAYARMLFCVADHQAAPELHKLCSHIVDAFAKRQSVKSEKKLRVLCLGFGVGIFEFPLLHCLRQKLRELDASLDIQITAIDASGGAIGCSAKLAQQILSDNSNARFPIRDGAEFAKGIEANWPSEPLARGGVIRVGDSHTFRCLDLDFSSESTGLAQYFPSRWYETLTGEEGSFHLILSMFCLHHLHWWRATLSAAVCRLLSPGGLFLVPELSGATDAFAGNLVSPELAPGGLLDCLRQSLYGPSGSEVWRTDARLLQARMTLPVITDFMCQVGSAHTADYAVQYETSIDAAVCLDLLKTRGFSVLRILAQEVDDYDKRCADFEKQCEGKGTCLVKHSVEIRLFQTEISPEKRAMFAAHFGIVRPTREKRLPKMAMDSYQLREAGLLTLSSIDAYRDPELVFVRDTLPGILHSGVLHPECIGLTIGPGLVRGENLSESVCCPNVFSEGGISLQNDANWDDERRNVIEQQLEDLMLFVRLRRIGGDPLRSFSNANLNLKRILPLFSPTPSVFTYMFDQAEHCKVDQPFFWIKILRRRAFWEVRHIISVNHPFTKAIRELARKRAPLGATLWEKVSNEKERRASEQLGRYRSLVVSPAVWIDEWDNVAEKYFDEQMAAFRLRVQEIADTYGVSEKLYAGWAKEINIEFDKEIKRAISPNIKMTPLFDAASVKAMAWLLVMRHCKSVAIYPAHYVSGSQIAADDATIAMYATELDESGSMVEGESAKFNAIYDAARMRSSERSGELYTSANLRHELKRVSSSLANLVQPANLTLTDKGPPLFTVDTTPHLGAASAGVCGRISLAPELPSEIREMIGVCFFPKTVNDIANLMKLWCQAPAYADLASLVGLRGTESFTEFIISIWQASLRMMAIALPVSFAFHRKRSSEENILDVVSEGLAKELHRLEGISALALAVGLTLEVVSTQEVECVRLTNEAGSWLGRAMLAILSDYALHAKPPIRIIVDAAINGQTFTIEVKTTQSTALSSSSEDLQVFVDVRKKAVEAYAQGQGAVMSSWHTEDVVKSCLAHIRAVGTEDSAQRFEASDESGEIVYAWKLVFNMGG